MIKIVFVVLSLVLAVFCQEDPFGVSHYYGTVNNCTGPADYSNYVRFGSCWPYGDGTWFYGTSTTVNGTEYFVYHYNCDSDNCTSCADEPMYEVNTCVPLSADESEGAELDVYVGVGATVLAYYVDDDACRLGNLTSMEGISKTYCYPYLNASYMVNNTENFAYVLTCDFHNCTNCHITETQPLNTCRHSVFGLGYVIFSAGSYSPYGNITSTSTTASATTTTTTTGEVATTTTTTTGEVATTTSTTTGEVATTTTEATTTTAAATATTTTAAATATTTTTAATATTTTTAATATTTTAASTATSTTAAATATTTTGNTTATATTTTGNTTATATTSGNTTSVATSATTAAAATTSTTGAAISVIVPAILIVLLSALLI